MTSLALRFPGRRYHATPWGHHVNEGQIEWPPSPWRILRALLSVGFTACGWATVPDQGRALIHRLAGVLPRYHLPATVGAHSRHYMPEQKFKNDREVSLVFDTWAQIDDGELVITWPCGLPPDETTLLADLAARLNYLGRSESWVAARMLPDDPADHNCIPVDEQPSLRGPGWDQVAVLSPVSAADYEAWREPQVAQVLADLPLPKVTGKKPTPKDQKLQDTRNAATAMYPADLIACLCADTGILRGQGWSQAPGSRRIFYWRRSDALEAGSPRSVPAEPRPKAVEAMLLAMATGTGNRHALPSMTRALPQAELLHQALVRSGGSHVPALRGTDDDHKPLSGHQHAHLLHLDLDGDGHLDHCLVWSPMGLDAEAQAAIRSVRQTFTKGGLAPLRLAVAANGSLIDLRRLSGAIGDGLGRVLGPSGGASQWRSVTPFVPPRFIKRSGRNTLEGQIHAELVARGLPVPSVAVHDLRDPSLLHLRHAIRIRRRGGAPPPVDCGYALTLTFPTPVPGPITLGYASHFGLGLFSAIHESP